MLRVEGEGPAATIRLIDRSYIKALSIQVRGILLKEENGKMELEAFKELFKKKYGFRVFNVEPQLSQLFPATTPTSTPRNWRPTCRSWSKSWRRKRRKRR